MPLKCSTTARKTKMNCQQLFLPSLSHARNISQQYHVECETKNHKNSLNFMRIAEGHEEFTLGGRVQGTWESRYQSHGIINNSTTQSIILMIHMRGNCTNFFSATSRRHRQQEKIKSSIFEAFLISCSIQFLASITFFTKTKFARCTK